MKTIYNNQHMSLLFLDMSEAERAFIEQHEALHKKVMGTLIDNDFYRTPIVSIGNYLLEESVYETGSPPKNRHGKMPPHLIQNQITKHRR